MLEHQFGTVCEAVSFCLYLQADSDPIHGFTEVFYLKQVGDGLFVFNDIFRLALHHQ